MTSDGTLNGEARVLARAVVKIAARLTQTPGIDGLRILAGREDAPVIARLAGIDGPAIAGWQAGQLAGQARQSSQQVPGHDYSADPRHDERVLTAIRSGVSSTERAKVLAAVATECASRPPAPSIGPPGSYPGEDRPQVQPQRSTEFASWETLHGPANGSVRPQPPQEPADYASDYGSALASAHTAAKPNA